MTKTHFNWAGIHPAVDSRWLSGLVPIQRSTVSFLGGSWFLHHVDPVQRTIWTACLLHWKDITGIATALNCMYFASLRQLTYWSWSTLSVKSANLLRHQAMWFCSYPFGIAHHSVKSSRVVISGHGVFIIRLIDAVVAGISSSQCCFAACAFSSRYWNTTCWAFVWKIWKEASWRFDCWYACSRSIIVLSRSSELTFKRSPSWRIWSEKWFSRWIFTKLRSDSSTRGCAIADSLCVLSSSTRRCVSATERLFQAGSLSHSSCLTKVRCIFNSSETFFVDLLVRNRLKISFWRWNSYRYFCMYSIVASVWYWYYAIMWQYTKFLTLNRASVKGILWLAKGFKRVAMKTGTTTCPSAFISLPLHCITSLYSLLNQARPEYGGIIARSW